MPKSTRVRESYDKDCHVFWQTLYVHKNLYGHKNIHTHKDFWTLNLVLRSSIFQICWENMVEKFVRSQKSNTDARMDVFSRPNDDVYNFLYCKIPMKVVLSMILSLDRSRRGFNLENKSSSCWSGVQYSKGIILVLTMLFRHNVVI